ncbi:unnamed protein product [Clonostachys solani]|uniref:Transcription factor domain-containing protein n=1 Tax=Clonostachys solani TaxID=160281 RepID=A0A9N9ZFQ3_9HYPO|nr:unnamed protein product [Clonostachys solani]
MPPYIDFNAMDGSAVGQVSNGIMSTTDFADLSVPFDLFSVLMDTEFDFDDTFQSLNSDMHIAATVLDDASQARRPSILHESHPNQSPVPAATAGPQRKNSHAPTEGYEAFKRSPWLWTPANQDHAYAESTQLSLDEAQVTQSSNFTYSKQASFQASVLTEHGARDDMLSMVLKFSTSNFKTRSFPSLNLLNTLMQAFFVRQNDCIDSWIHVGTFNPNTCKSEQLAGIVATGSALFAVSNVWKMGLALQEIVRLAVCSSVDSDNRNIRNLQTNQTFLLWIDLGLWSGFRRKMEIGEGFAHNLPTLHVEDAAQSWRFQVELLYAYDCSFNAR